MLGRASSCRYVGKSSGSAKALRFAAPESTLARAGEVVEWVDADSRSGVLACCGLNACRPRSPLSGEARNWNGRARSSDPHAALVLEGGGMASVVQRRYLTSVDRWSPDFSTASPHVPTRGSLW